MACSKRHDSLHAEYCQKLREKYGKKELKDVGNLIKPKRKKPTKPPSNNKKMKSKMVVKNSPRAEWKTGTVCQIYSNTEEKWFNGEVAEVIADEGGRRGEWLKVRFETYDKSMSKQIPRFHHDIRPHVCVFYANLHTI